MPTARATTLGRVLIALSVLWALAPPSSAGAQLRISNLSVFLNDFDVTVNVVLLGALPESMHEGLHSGIATHVRLYVELWQQNRVFADRLIQARTVERQVLYNVLTKEYKVVSLGGEQ